MPTWLREWILLNDTVTAPWCTTLRWWRMFQTSMFPLQCSKRAHLWKTSKSRHLQDHKAILASRLDLFSSIGCLRSERTNWSSKTSRMMSCSRCRASSSLKRNPPMRWCLGEPMVALVKHVPSCVKKHQFNSIQFNYPNSIAFESGFPYAKCWRPILANEPKVPTVVFRKMARLGIVPNFPWSFLSLGRKRPTSLLETLYK